MNTIKNSHEAYRRLSFLIAAAAMLSPSTLRADSLPPMNLRDMCLRADKIFRGVVIAAIPGTVQVGGGELPVVTYRIRVDEAFKGDFQTVKGVRFTEVRMLGTPARKNGDRSPTIRFSLEMPRLEVKQTYLLLTTRASAIGMSSPVGLGQGCFRITGQRNGEEAANSFGNKMLFRGVEQATATRQTNVAKEEARGPLKYSHLAEQIRNLVREQRRTQ